MTPAPLLIPLATGLCVGGVTTWAVRLANGLARRGRGAALLLHPEPAGNARLEVEIDERVAVFAPADLPPFDRPGDLSAHIPRYREAAERLARRFGGPVAIAPSGHGDAFGAAAALCLAEPQLVRVLGWQHSDIEYDTRVLTRYEPVIARYIAVSDRIAATLRSRLPGRESDIHNIPYGVEVSPEAPSPRPPLRGRPLNLIYTGRLEHEQKRILALTHMCVELSRQGIDHRLAVVGDGPAAAEFDAHARAIPSIRRLGPASPQTIVRLLREADALVLPSRYEGLSIAMLEAMAAGCVPIPAKTASGVMQAVEPGYSGEIAAVEPAEDERAAGLALAAAVARFRTRDTVAMALSAWRTALDRFSLLRHLETVERLLDEAAASLPRNWPGDRPCAFTAGSGTAATQGSGSVPPEGAARLAALLQALAGRRIIIHGAGQHTLQLGAVLAASPAQILAFTDDDRQRWGGQLWNWPIIPPAQAGDTGATDLVISSWMHQEAIWSRRDFYEAQGLRIHRIYPSTHG